MLSQRYEVNGHLLFRAIVVLEWRRVWVREVACGITLGFAESACGRPNLEIQEQLGCWSNLGFPGSASGRRSLEVLEYSRFRGVCL